MNNIQRFLEMSSESLGHNMNDKNTLNNLKLSDLYDLLVQKNGFSVFEGSMRFLTTDVSFERNLDRWNDWLSEKVSAGLFFFADNILGESFCFYEEKFWKYDFESGDLEYISDDFIEFVNKIVQDYNYYSAHSLAQQWQSIHGKIDFDSVLMPKIPFVLGGEYTLDNLYLVNIYDAIEFKIYLNRKIKNLEDGEKIKFKLD